VEHPTEVPLAEAFGYPGVAHAYQHRPPYPDMVFDVLTGLITDAPQVVLDLGAGEGALARPLAARVDQVDAVDISAAMIEEGRQRPGGDAPNLRWIVGAAETAPLDGPYALVTAGAARHWMRWQETFERLAAVMTASTPLRQRTGDYIEYLHSTASLAREWMEPAETATFDRAATEIVSPFEKAECVALGAVDTAVGRVHDQAVRGRSGDRLAGYVQGGIGWRGRRGVRDEFQTPHIAKRSDLFGHAGYGVPINDLGRDGG